jgi:peptidoglycan hydrolase FlgJ
MSDISKLANPPGIDFTKSINLKKDVQMSDEKLREVADLYEKHFIKEMMKQMKATLPEGGLIKKNNAEEIFQDQLDDQYSAEWNKNGSFGISDLIYKQLTEKFGSNDKNLEKPAGPIEFKKPSEMLKMLDSKEHTYKINPKNSDFKNVDGTSNKNIDVKSPWAGTLQNKNQMNDDQTSYRIKHDNGLESLILIRGGADAETRHLSQGDQIQAGQNIGKADATSPLFWTIKKSVS